MEVLPTYVQSAQQTVLAKSWAEKWQLPAGPVCRAILGCSPAQSVGTQWNRCSQLQGAHHSAILGCDIVLPKAILQPLGNSTIQAGAPHTR